MTLPPTPTIVVMPPQATARSLMLMLAVLVGVGLGVGFAWLMFAGSPAPVAFVSSGASGVTPISASASYPPLEIRAVLELPTATATPTKTPTPIPKSTQTPIGGFCDADHPSPGEACTMPASTQLPPTAFPSCPTNPGQVCRWDDLPTPDPVTNGESRVTRWRAEEGMDG